MAWIDWFCRANPYFVDVDEDYIDDQFNLVGLQDAVPYYVESLEYIQDIQGIATALTCHGHGVR